VDYEIIFVNDGSPDDADAVLKELTAQDDHVLAIEHSRNFGSQSAFVSGMQFATGDAVILLDGDLQDPPELVSDFCAKWQEGYDVVYGRRGKREGSLVFALLVKGFYRIFRGVSDVPMPLDAGDFSLMDRRVVDALLALPETDQFLRGLRAWVGFRQTGVDYLRPKRAFGRSTHGFLKNVWWARKGVFSFSFLPIELLGYAGATMTAISFFALVYQSVDALFHPEVPHGISIIIVLVAFFGSLHLLAIAILGEYVIKILEETKRRPRFIRKAIRHRGTRFTKPAEIDGFLQERHAASQRPPGTQPYEGDKEGDGS
jgi:dolichol-phosphate mannosyltransferase